MSKRKAVMVIALLIIIVGLISVDKLNDSSNAKAQELREWHESFIERTGFSGNWNTSNDIVFANHTNIFFVNQTIIGNGSIIDGFVNYLDNPDDWCAMMYGDSLEFSDPYNQTIRCLLYDSDAEYYYHMWNETAKVTIIGGEIKE